MTEKTRALIYRTALAVLGLAVVYGIVADNAVAAWTALITAVVGNGLAAANTSTHSRPDA